MITDIRTGMSEPLPLNIEDVTREWLEEALQHTAPGIRLHRMALDDTWAGTATKLRVVIEANDAARDAQVPSSLIIKGRFARELQPLEGIYANEVMFYRDLAPRLDISVPRCFFAGHDHAHGQHLVVLEDLNCRGVEFLRVIRPISYEPAARFLENMARWHARFWNSPEFEAGGPLSHLYQWDAISPTPAGDHGRHQLQQDVWDHHMNLPRGIGMPKRFRDRDWMAAAIEQLNAFGRTGAQTLLHGDHHLGDLYVDADGGVGVLD